MNFRRHQEPDALEINLIPLIDVLLVILIFLAASTSFTRYHQMKVALPQAAAQALEPQAIAVSVSRNGDYAVNGQALNGISIQEIAQGLLALSRPLDTESVLVIYADAQAPHEAVIRVMQAARDAGIERVNFATQGSP